MLDIKVRRIQKNPPYYECKLTCYGATFDFGVLDKEEAEAFAETLREAAEELDPGGERT